MSLKILTLIILVINYVYGKQERIIGGFDAQRYEFPYQAVLRRISDNAILGGGAIISNRHILTAAHSLDARLINRNNLKICLGGSNQTHLFMSEHLPSEIFIHPDFMPFNNEGRTLSNDIAVIKTHSIIYFDQYTQIILLPDRQIRDRDVATVSGWGALTFPTLTFPDRLKRITMIVIDVQNCQSRFPVSLYSDHFCAYMGSGHGLWIGDGGNPLVKDNKVIGLFSMSYGCACGVPDVYTDVYAHLPFIAAAMSL